MNSLKEKSKFVSYVLRHKPEAIGLTLDKEGWASVSDLLQANGKTQLTLEELRQIVAEDEKGRYSFSADGTKIRANQGHSTTQVRLTFERAVPPPVLYHGTSLDNLQRVQKMGLLPMKRHYVHLSADISTATDVAGRRKGEIQVLKIDTGAMLKDGFKFFISENKVWLAEQVPAKYITLIK